MELLLLRGLSFKIMCYSNAAGIVAGQLDKRRFFDRCSGYSFVTCLSLFYVNFTGTIL